MIKYIFYILIIVLVLTYFGFDLKSFMESSQTQSNLSYLWELVIKVWNWIKPVYDFISDFFGPYIHQTITALQNHQPIPMGPVNSVIPKIK